MTTKTIGERIAAGPDDGLPRTPFWEAQVRLGRGCVTLRSGTRRFLNVTAAMVRQSIADLGRTPVWTVREAEHEFHPSTAREVEIFGTVEGVHVPADPLPCTEGRGVAFLVTEGAIRCYLDPGLERLPDEMDAATNVPAQPPPSSQPRRHSPFFS
jgi:hypothetical protein